MSERQGTGATNGKDKTAGENGIASLPPVSSKFTVTAADLHTSSVPKVRPQRRTDYLISPKKIRNVTLV